ncbi:E3 ubiquitin-protein ligase ORTHRUS 2-like [Gastrolobium bilobum]|uniref:E3 ubiquitin-protein ligase ORTHRUS 2-like n=1 Tax=Gastrolobium bilobum TaxID=150636 RepID=UPI002AAFA849|nr:E3 ubiquitin-protein ligase ORTHRUS 2-like [Gastrolobium bilobum]
MAQPNKQLPCDADGFCMLCKHKPSSSDTLACRTCATPWHVSCLTTVPITVDWDCPDCTSHPDNNPAPIPAGSGGLVSEIRAIESDTSLTEKEKAKKRQELLGGSVNASQSSDKNVGNGNGVLDIFDGKLNCSFCMQLPDRPVTTPCGHNFCLKCFEKWIGQGKRTCANCRHDIPPKMASQPRINSQLAIAIRLAKIAKSEGSPDAPKVHQFIRNQDRPDQAFTTDRAKKTGKANACSGKIFVTIPPDHFGPITAENDPTRNRGVLVGDTWEDRMECRQWGAHFPHVAGIAGQSSYGAQSVALSGGYEDDEDHGEWFLYTGSGGRDLSGNKRTNKKQSFDQKFENMNEALRVSCHKGYPVRVVRSHKEKRSSYAPESGVRYDGVYRIEKCWRKDGIQGCKVCRYLFVRCDNEPAPWTSDDRGDRPRPLPNIEELNDAVDLTERKSAPSWDYDEEKGSWLWKRPQPESKKLNRKDGKIVCFKRKVKSESVKERLLKEFGCHICHKVMTFPLTTPCAHNFCKACLEGAFSGQSFVRDRACKGGRTLRAQKNIMKCPSCSIDIADFLQNPQVNREMMGLIESLQSQMEENSEESSCKNDENSKNLQDGTEVLKPSDDSSEKVLEEINDNDLNRPQKRRNTDSGAGMVNKEENIDEVELEDKVKTSE